RILDFPSRAALRLENSERYLQRTLGDDYEISKLVNKSVPAGQTVFAPAPFGRSYLERNLIVGWESGFGENLAGSLEAARWTHLLRVEYRFPAQRLSRLRLVQTGTNVESYWRINELRFYRSGQELSRNSAWRLTASPNPWDVQLAFDNNPVT